VRAATREHLAFNLGGETVPGRAYIDAILASEPELTFATAPRAEPRDWGYFGLLLFTAVLLLRPQDDFPFLNPFHIAEVCAIVGIGPMMMHRFARRLPVFRVTGETIGLIAFGFAILASVPFSIWPGGSLNVFTDSFFKILVVVVLMMNTLTTPKRLNQMIWLVVVCCGYVAFRATLDYARGVNLVEGDAERLNSVIGGIFGNPNDLAMNMVTFLPVAIVFAVDRRTAPWRRAAAVFIAMLMLVTIVFTKSRAGVLGLLAVVICLIFLGTKVRRGFGRYVVLVLVLGSPFAPKSFWDRMESIVDDETDKTEFTGTRQARRELMEAGIDVFVERPLTGIGAGEFQAYNPPWRKQPWTETHNTPIQVAAETGVFGLVAFLFLVFSTFVAAFRTRKMLARPPTDAPRDALSVFMSDDDRHSLYVVVVGLTTGLIGWFVCALFASVAYNWTFYYLLAPIVCARELTMDRLRAGQVALGERPASVRRRAGAARLRHA
jgi:O-antigen ligase